VAKPVVAVGFGREIDTRHHPTLQLGDPGDASVDDRHRHAGPIDVTTHRETDRLGPRKVRRKLVIADNVLGVIVIATTAHGGVVIVLAFLVVVLVPVVIAPPSPAIRHRHRQPGCGRRRLDHASHERGADDAERKYTLPPIHYRQLTTRP
jgi:hypothetical protein